MPETTIDPALVDHWNSIEPNPGLGPIFDIGFPQDSTSLVDSWWQPPYAVPGDFTAPVAPVPANPIVPAAPAQLPATSSDTPIDPLGKRIVDEINYGGDMGSKALTELGVSLEEPFGDGGPKVLEPLGLASDLIGTIEGVTSIAKDGFNWENSTKTAIKATKVAGTLLGAPGGNELSWFDYMLGGTYDPRDWWAGAQLMGNDVADKLTAGMDWLHGPEEPRGLFGDGSSTPKPRAPLEPGVWTEPNVTPEVIGDMPGSPSLVVSSPDLPMVVPPEIPPMPDFTAPKAPVIPPSLPLPPEARLSPMVIEQPAATAPGVAPAVAPEPTPTPTPTTSDAPSVAAPSMHLGSAAAAGGLTGGLGALGTDLYRKYVLGEDVSAGAMATNTTVGAAVGAGSNVASEVVGAGIAKAAAPVLGAGANLVGAVAGGGIVNGAVAGLTSTFSNASKVESGEVDAAHATANVAVDAGVGLAGGLAGAATGAAIGSVVPVAGTALGAGLGFVGGGLATLAVSMAAEHSGFSDWAKGGLGDALGVAEQPLDVMWSGINGGIDGAATGAMVGGGAGAAMGALGTGLTGAALGFMAGGPVGALLGGAAGAGAGAIGGGLVGASLGALPGAAIGAGMGVADGLMDWLCPSEEQPGDFS